MSAAAKVASLSRRDTASNPQRDTQVSAQAPFFELSPASEVFPPWLGGMTQEEAGLTLTLVARA
jgi:hypothetical protein